VFKGRGMAFSEVRPYYAGRRHPHDRLERHGAHERPHVKQFTEERDRTVNLMIDMSASGYFGSRGAAKRELAAELAAVVAFSAIKNNDRVGLIIVTDRVELYVPPKKGRRHVLRVIGEILAFEPASRGTDLAARSTSCSGRSRAGAGRVPGLGLPVGGLWRRGRHDRDRDRAWPIRRRDRAAAPCGLSSSRTPRPGSCGCVDTRGAAVRESATRGRGAPRAPGAFRGPGRGDRGVTDGRTSSRSSVLSRRERCECGPRR
jgi:hypothetical protein